MLFIACVIFCDWLVFSLCLSFRPPRAYLALWLPGPLALPVPMLVLDIEFLKINHFRPRRHLACSFSMVTNLSILVSCLPFPGNRRTSDQASSRYDHSSTSQKDLPCFLGPLECSALVFFPTTQLRLSSDGPERADLIYRSGAGS